MGLSVQDVPGSRSMVISGPRESCGIKGKRAYLESAKVEKH